MEFKQVDKDPPQDSYIVKYRYYFLKPILMNMFISAGIQASCKPYSCQEIFGLLHTYIQRNNLCNKDLSGVIKCRGTPLSTAFGVQEFRWCDVRVLLSQSIIPCVPANNAGDCSTPSTSQLSQPTTSHAESKTLGQNGICIPIPNIPEYISEPETEHSYQGYATALCNTELDTDVAMTEDVDESEHFNETEFEPVSEEEKKTLDKFNDSDSDMETLELMLFAVHQHRFSDDTDEDECFADESNATTSDAESVASIEDERDKWDCFNCGVKNNKPFMRYCLKCWQLRKDWYPDPPKRQKKRKPRPKKSRKGPHKRKREGSGEEEEEKPKHLPLADKTETSNLAHTSANCDLAPSNVTENPSPVEDTKMTKKQKVCDFKEPSENASQTVDSSSTIQRLQSKEDEKMVAKMQQKFTKFLRRTDGHQWLTSQSGDQLKNTLLDISSGSEIEEGTSEMLCTLCYTRPHNASIIHGRIAHTGFCYPCVKRLHHSKSRCPACRRKIHMIVRNIPA